MVVANLEAWRAELKKRAKDALTAAGWRGWIRARGEERGTRPPAILKLTHVLIALVAGYAVLAGVAALVWLLW